MSIMNLKEKALSVKPQYSLRLSHKLGTGIFLVLAILFLFHPQAYKKEWKNVPSVYFSFLQAGDYALDYTLTASPGTEASIQVISATTVDSDNHAGVILAQKALEQDALHDSLTFCLEEGFYNINVQISDESVSFSKFNIQSVQLLCTDHYLMSFLCFFSALFIAFLGLYIPADKYKMPLLAASFGLLASLPMANDFLIITVPDTGFHLARLESVYQGLRAGEFPVRIGSVQMNGYGSLSAVMYPQFFLYPVAFLRFFKVSLLMCYKILVTGMNVSCAVLTYYAVKNVCKSKKTGLCVSFLYTFSIYRLIDIYQRGALGESLALTFLPFIMWGIYEILWGNHRKWHLLALGVSAVLQSHVLSMEMCAFFLGASVLFRCLQKDRKLLGKRIFAGVKATLLTVFLNASFLVPFLFFCGEDLQCFHMPNEVSKSLLYFNQMFFSFPHADGSSKALGTLSGEMPLTVGGILFLGMILFVVMASKRQGEEQSHEERVGIYCLVCGLAALFLTSWIFPWETLSRIPLFNAIACSLQFAWRFLGLASLFLCVVTAVGLKLFERKEQGRRWIYGFAMLLVFLSASYFFEMSARESQQSNDKMEINGSNITDSLYMYYDGKSFKAHHLNPAYQVPEMRSTAPQTTYSGLRRQGAKLWVEVMPDATSATSEDVLIFPIYYYPGYEVSINGKAVECYNCNTQLACNMPTEYAKVEVRYAGHSTFFIGDLISLFTLALSIIYILLSRRKKGDDLFHRQC